MCSDYYFKKETVNVVKTFPAFTEEIKNLFDSILYWFRYKIAFKSSTFDM